MGKNTLKKKNHSFSFHLTKLFVPLHRSIKSSHLRMDSPTELIR